MRIKTDENVNERTENKLKENHMKMRKTKKVSMSRERGERHRMNEER